MRTLLILGSAILLLGCDTNRSLGDDLQVRLVAPLAGAGTGSPYSAAASKPTLRWTSSSAAGTYQVQVDDSCDLAAPCTFPSPEIDDSSVTTTSYVPAAELAVAKSLPHRQRYHWRVRACREQGCGDWSGARFFVVGQDMALNRDLNGDGYSDFLIGAPNSSAVLAQAGQAFVHLGRPSLSPQPALVINSDVPLDELGHAVAMAGDVNGDGFGDFLVQTTGNNMSIGTQPGRVLLFLGGTTLKAQPDITFAGGNVDDENGSMAGCGDLNGDGYDDIAFAVTDIDANHNAIQPARVEIHFGGPTMATSQALVLLGESEPDFFGSSISAAGDVNGDGFSDLIVGSHQGADSGGRVRVYFGGPHMDATPDVILEGPSTASLFGFSVAGVGDVNGDGFADLAVGAPSTDGHPAPLGHVYVYFGGPQPHTTPDLVLDGNYEAEWFGQKVVPAGDLNHDGYADIAVLARGVPAGTLTSTVAATVHPATAGKAYLFAGGESPSPFPFASVPSGTAFPVNFSLAVSDVDGDAEPEILVGQLADYPSPSSGQVSIYRRSNNYATPALTTASASSSSDWFGFAISR